MINQYGFLEATICHYWTCQNKWDFLVHLDYILGGWLEGWRHNSRIEGNNEGWTKKKIGLQIHWREHTMGEPLIICWKKTNLILKVTNKTLQNLFVNGEFGLWNAETSGNIGYSFKRLHACCFNQKWTVCYFGKTKCTWGGKWKYLLLLEY